MNGLMEFLREFWFLMPFFFLVTCIVYCDLKERKKDNNKCLKLETNPSYYSLKKFDRGNNKSKIEYEILQVEEEDEEAENRKKRGA